MKKGTVITAALVLALVGATWAARAEAASHARATPPVEALRAPEPPAPAPTSSRKIDEYGDIRWEDEKPRLDNFAIETRNAPGAVGYIIGYAGRVAREGELRRRMERAKRYLVTVRKIEPERIVLIDGGHRESLSVELYVLPSGFQPPAAAPTVDPSEVKIIKGKKKRARRRS